MNKLSRRNVQMFVAGALALTGFRELFWLPYYLVVSKDVHLVTGSILSGLSLLIGISIFVGNARAILWAKIYLGLNILVFAVIFLIFPLLHSLTSKPQNFSLKSVLGFATVFILYLLLVWSTSKRFSDNPDA
jgi:Ca2+/H+ antiporter